MIVLVDTSVWIPFLSNRAPCAAQLEELLSRDEVCGHDFVYGELLIGDVGGRTQLLALGIGANTAIFGVVNALLLRPLPIADPIGS